MSCQWMYYLEVRRELDFRIKELVDLARLSAENGHLESRYLYINKIKTLWSFRRWAQGNYYA